MKRSRPKSNKLRAAYRDQECQLCHHRRATCVHEIAQGPAREKALAERTAWLALCTDCHQRMHDPSDFPLERQYALKYVEDAEHFDRVQLNRLRGRADDAIDWVDMAKYLDLKEQ